MNFESVINSVRMGAVEFEMPIINSSSIGILGRAVGLLEVITVFAVGCVVNKP